MARRGPYAKGLSRRREILRTALEVIVRTGYSSASVRELAERVGLSQAGLLHHFGTKEELFVEVLRARDEVDAGLAEVGEAGPGEEEAGSDEGAAGGAPAGRQEGIGVERFLNIIRRNAVVPGLVHLYVRLQAEAADSSHVAAEYFRQRQQRVRQGLVQGVSAEQRQGRMPADLDPEAVARTLMALADGAQAQWLHDPEVDMAGLVSGYVEQLRQRA